MTCIAAILKLGGLLSPYDYYTGITINIVQCSRQLDIVISRCGKRDRAAFSTLSDDGHRGGGIFNIVSFNKKRVCVGLPLLHTRPRVAGSSVGLIRKMTGQSVP